MFSPVFSITNKTLQSLIDVEIANRIIALSQLQPDWETRLNQECLVKKVFGMARFSGCDLNIDSVAKIVKDEPGRDDKASGVALRTGVVGKEKDIQLILNLLNTNRLIEQMAFLAGKFKQGDFGEKELAQINVLLGERLVLPENAGKYRDKKPDNDYPGTTSAVEIPFQIEDLFSWFESRTKNEIHVINKAGVMMYELLRISPFTENNLLCAISFFRLILSSEGYGFRKMISFEEEILRNKESFNQAFLSVERNAGDLTIWIEYLSKCLSVSSGNELTKVMNLVGDTPIFKSESGKAISLTERQIAIMEDITLKNEMTIKEIRNILPMVSDDTILRDLKDLIEKKLIRKKGKTKGAVYVIGKVRSYR